LMWQFKLNNPEVAVADQNDLWDLAYRTETQARNCTITEMLAVSLLLNINIEDQSPAGLARIKNQFLARAKYQDTNPKGKERLEQFMEIINNPTTKLKYIFAQGLSHGILSTQLHPGKLSWAKLDTPILALDGVISTVDELAARWVDKEDVVVELLAEVEKQLKA
jgi:hypothetical protein